MFVYIVSDQGYKRGNAVSGPSAAGGVLWTVKIILLSCTHGWQSMFVLG